MSAWQPNGNPGNPRSLTTPGADHQQQPRIVKGVKR